MASLEAAAPIAVIVDFFIKSLRVNFSIRWFFDDGPNNKKTCLEERAVDSRAKKITPVELEKILGWKSERGNRKHALSVPVKTYS
jgi:hypothetical protein